MTEYAGKEYRIWLTATNKQRGLQSFTKWLTITHEQLTDHLLAPTGMNIKSARSSRPPVLMGTTDVPTMEDSHEYQADPFAVRCKLCFTEKHKFSDCRQFMTMNPDQRKLALLRYSSCYICTDIGHTALKCHSNRLCQLCQSSKHHETICKADYDSWQAVLNKTSPKIEPLSDPED